MKQLSFEFVSQELIMLSEDFELRYYQDEIKRGIYQAIKDGHKKILVYGPTGSGKTAIFSSIINDILSKDKKSMLIVHRDFLVEQSKKSIVNTGINSDDIGVIKSGYREDRHLPIQIAGMQSLQNRPTPANLDFVILDECHTTAFFEHYNTIKQDTSNAIHIGFSASPWRLKSHEEYFGLHFDTIVEGPRIGELIEKNYLSRPRYFGYGGLIDLTRLETNKSGDFKELQMQKAFMDSLVPQKVVEKIVDYCDNRTGIIFNAGVEQSKLQTKLLNDASIVTVHLDANTPFKEREDYFKKLSSGEIQVISSIGCLTEGFDVPNISFVVLARATKSRALYVQMAGRGLRIADGKNDCLILDFGGNVKRLGMLHKKFPITLEPTPKREDSEMLKECPQCHSLVSVFARICPECCYEFDCSGEGEDNTDAFESEFGELFDKETLRQVKYARSQRKTRFSKQQHPDKLWETFSDKHNTDGKTFLCADWLFGAIFGNKDNDYNRQRLLEYLEPFAPFNEKTKANWIRYHLELEFGKPMRLYRAGKNKTFKAKKGINKKMNWWDILQCSSSATWVEIKTNYQKLARLYHPDISGNDTTAEMQLINLAYDKVKILKGV